MNVTYEQSPRASQQQTAMALEDRFEVVKDIGDGSFGSVALARVRSAGANVARRGTMVSSICFKIHCRSPSDCRVPSCADKNVILGRYQDYEENFRVFHSVFGIA